jgi:hypothetical protein
MSNIRIRPAGDGASPTLESLYRWLKLDNEVSRHATVTISPRQSNPETQGSTFDIIELIASSSFSTLNLALAYLQWRRSSNNKHDVFIFECGTRQVIAADDSELTAREIAALDSSDNESEGAPEKSTDT